MLLTIAGNSPTAESDPTPPWQRRKQAAASTMLRLPRWHRTISAGVPPKDWCLRLVTAAFAPDRRRRECIPAHDCHNTEQPANPCEVVIFMVNIRPEP